MTKIADIARASKSKSFQELNPGFFKTTHSELVREETPEASKPLISNRGDNTKLSIGESNLEKSLNKTERAFLGLLRSLNHPWIGIQCWKLNLGDNCGYTPDFFVLDKDGQLQAIEVKGFWRDDARVKIKVAARTYRFIKFTAVQYKQKAWIVEEIKP